MPTSPILDLDAARREAGRPDGLTIRFGGEDFTLPAELPLDVIDPFLADELGLIDIIREVVATGANPKVLIEIAFDPDRKTFQRFFTAVNDALRLLFDGGDVRLMLPGETGRPGQYDRFQVKRPGLGDYSRLINYLVDTYGVGLGEVFRSVGLPESSGPTSSPTSPGTTPTSSEVEPDPVSGGDPAPEPDSSVSAG